MYAQSTLHLEVYRGILLELLHILDFSNSLMFPVKWPLVVAFVYLALLIAGIFLSFITQRSPRRRNIRIATIALTTPIWLAISLVVFLWFTVFREPPTLTELQKDYPSKRADLEMILLMFDEDANFSRIAPDFLYRTPGTTNQLGLYMANNPNAGLSVSRWDAYRKLYSRNGIKLGIQRDAARDAFIMVNSVGFLNRGHTSGYLHCVADAPDDDFRFYPCMLHEERGEQKSDRYSNEEGYSFQKLDDRWYAYDEGPG